MSVIPTRRSANYAIPPGEIVIGFAPLQEWPESILQSVLVPDSDGNYPAIGGVATYGPGGREVWMNTSFMEGNDFPVSTDAESLAGMVHELIHAVVAFAHVDTHFGVDHSIGVYGGEGDSIMSPGAGGGAPYGNGAVLYPIDRAALQAAFSGPDSLDAWNDTALHYWGRFDGFEAGATHRNGYAHGWAHGDMPYANLADCGLFGTATWSGHLFGLTPAGQAVTGGAHLRVNLSVLDGSVRFADIRHRTTGATWGDGDLSYTVAVQGNTFIQTGGDSGYVTGAFFGSGHEGMGGVLERHDLAAGFGGKRPAVSQDETQERIDELIQADPAFLGSEVFIIYEGGRETTGSAVCTSERCTIDGQDTTLEALLGADGFAHATTRRGVDLGRGSLMHFEGEIRRWGGWLHKSAFAVHSGILTDGEPGTPYYVEENIIHAYSVGNPSGTNPAAGSATWTGMMVGADTSGTASTGNFVQGDAAVTVSFAAETVDVIFDSITDLSTGVSHPDLEWTDLALTDGEFDGGTIEGRFYGAEHGEVGGIFERANLLGAFGASR